MYSELFGCGRYYQRENGNARPTGREIQLILLVKQSEGRNTCRIPYTFIRISYTVYENKPHRHTRWVDARQTLRSMGTGIVSPFCLVYVYRIHKYAFRIRYTKRNHIDMPDE